MSSSNPPNQLSQVNEPQSWINNSEFMLRHVSLERVKRDTNTMLQHDAWTSNFFFMF